MLQVSRRTVVRWLKEGRLKGLRVETCALGREPTARRGSHISFAGGKEEK